MRGTGPNGATPRSGFNWMLDVCGAEFCWLELKLPLTCDTFRVCDVNTDAATDWLSGEGAVGWGGAGEELNTPATEETVNMSEQSFSLSHTWPTNYTNRKTGSNRNQTYMDHSGVQFTRDQILEYSGRPYALQPISHKLPKYCIWKKWCGPRQFHHRLFSYESYNPLVLADNC